MSEPKFEARAARSPEARSTGHNLHFELSLALHAQVARRLDDTILESARHRLDEWIARGGSTVPLLARWREILNLPLEEVRRFLTDPSEEAAWLRKASPFAGVLEPRERERVIRQVREEAKSSA